MDRGTGRGGGAVSRGADQSTVVFAGKIAKFPGIGPYVQRSRYIMKRQRKDGVTNGAIVQLQQESPANVLLSVDATQEDATIELPRRLKSTRDVLQVWRQRCQQGFIKGQIVAPDVELNAGCATFTFGSSLDEDGLPSRLTLEIY